MDDELLTRCLHDLTDGAPVPATATDEDVRRGRTRLRRRRTAVVAGAAGAVATTLVCVALVGSGQGGPDGRSGRGDVAVDPSPAPTPAPTPIATPQGRTCLPTTERMRPDPAISRVVRGYREILAERLDPQGAHLDRWQVTRSVQSSTSQSGCPEGSGWTAALGTKVGWRVAGESGQGVVRVFVVAPGRWPDSSIVASYETWQDRPVSLPGVVSAEVAEHDGGTAVVVHRSDGFTVEIDANTLFGNNSVTPVSGLDVTVEQLLAAAADPRFTLP
ncbi:hypothetical protein FHP29_03835 [Nocardioides albidus]|uniref:Uncharacterized protein n=1 Tax=Nocardioides albidus TaxID=1517589 RepID=A0A5C4WES6_9ACTN|nr:hypothetical protein [Nocardioides albidus]TNM46076.1 hypothetical protein FHP29_03835 [Nocardioides albidus]